jgi:hypothetical protein
VQRGKATCDAIDEELIGVLETSLAVMLMLSLFCRTAAETESHIFSRNAAEEVRILAMSG